MHATQAGSSSGQMTFFHPVVMSGASSSIVALRVLLSGGRTELKYLQSYAAVFAVHLTFPSEITCPASSAPAHARLAHARTYALPIVFNQSHRMTIGLSVGVEEIGRERERRGGGLLSTASCLSVSKSVVAISVMDVYLINLQLILLFRLTI